jgi:predicted Ser/Thr protein kinase
MLSLGETDPLAIASYRLLGVLGGGGMGKVYLGESRSGRRVAIKVVRSELASDPAFRRRFAREVAAVRAVSPLFTAAVVDADADAAEPWLATTYIDGPSLATLVGTAGPLAPGAVLILAAGLADGLASIHRAGLVHRDLKPSNVIVNEHGPHIIDFGIALSAEAGATSSLLLGTPSYIAPERIHGSEADPASDIFSLGATLVYAATGQPLVNEGPVYAQLMQIATGRFSFDPVPPELRPLITRCVSLRAKDRPTADELTRLLSAAGIPPPTSGWFAAGVAGPTVSVSPSSRRLLTRRRALIAGGVIGASAAASAVAAVILEPTPPVAYAMRVLGRAAAAESPVPPPPPPAPGTVLWQLRSGAAPIDPSPGQVPAGQRILVDAARIVTSLGSDVVATLPDGRADWRTPLPAGLVTLRRWGDAVLVNDARRLWLLDWATGTQRFVASVVDVEEQVLGAAGIVAAAQIGDIALAADRAFVSLGTATIAVDRSTGTKLWRVPRPLRQGPDAPPPTGGPVTANEAWLLTQVPNETGSQVALRSAKFGSLTWTTGLPPADPVNEGPGGGGPPGGGPPPPDDNNPPGGQGDDPRRGSDVDWYRVEGRLTPTYAVLREARNIRALNVSGGGIRWQHLAPAPVVSMTVVGDLVLVGGDRLTAVSLTSGAQRWQAALRGARVASTPDGRLILAASDEGFVALSADGVTQWRADIPSAFADSNPDHVSADEHTAFITFKPRDSQRGPLDVDVLAIALDEQAVRPGR